LRKFAVWASLVSQILIVVTGGIVRLTGSGLGCPTWPKCTSDSLVTVEEQGIHGLIEFGNRLLTFALLVIAVLTLVVFWKSAQRALSIALLAGIPAQAVLGGITVITGLNPWLVGAHFALSAVLIALASLLVWRFYAPASSTATRQNRLLAIAVTVAGLISVVFGVIVTGAGPHAGDAKTPRNGLDLEIWQHYHSYPAYLTLALTLTALLLATKGSLHRKITLGLLGALLYQAAIGVIQARTGVPPLLVGLHVTGAAVLCSLLWFQLFATKQKR
jgi:cytochrome c oxidase assembly protein subunit 15